MHAVSMARRFPNIYSFHDDAYIEDFLMRAGSVSLLPYF